MKITDFKSGNPTFLIEEYFHGALTAWGLFEDRFGNIRRQFTVDISGQWNGQELSIDENFLYNDGEQDHRLWTITKTAEHLYEGRAHDVVGTAFGEARGNALHWNYDVILKIQGRSVRVHFDDWMFQQSETTLLGRAWVSKFGISIGNVTLAFTKH